MSVLIETAGKWLEKLMESVWFLGFMAILHVFAAVGGVLGFIQCGNIIAKIMFAASAILMISNAAMYYEYFVERLKKEKKAQEV